MIGDVCDENVVSVDPVTSEVANVNAGHDALLTHRLDEIFDEPLQIARGDAAQHLGHAVNQIVTSKRLPMLTVFPMFRRSP